MSEDANTDRFDNYEAELKLVTADLSQKLDQIRESPTGEPRKALVSAATRLADEAKELLTSMRMEKSSIPASQKSKVNTRLRNHETDVDGLKRQLTSFSSDKAALFGNRYRDDPESGDVQLEQRQQLLSGTERLGRSSARLQDAQRTALETETIGAGTLNDLAAQRSQLENSRNMLLESEGYTDRSMKTLRGMARRMATNRIITIAIITILVILIIAVIVSKFR
ncbi:hypothetical protein FH972_023160 [Carpinus fangiana]|uniref:t-SNARE coiled-coil homology domain-containing protein n=1 Tax=Carpinus fangiana TaxID=176857 RepID=A0A5N6KUN0_9ROSI|nr:hypothetical protein FH972_023160 [Carpinus fangiana]